VPEIIELLAAINSQLSAANLRNFANIVEAILAISAPVTTLSLSRFCRSSYRTVQRFYALKDINWQLIRLLLFRAFVYQPAHHYLLAGDETTQSKAGKHTHGIARFYSSLLKGPVRSVSLLAFSLLDVQTRKSSLIGCQQLIKAKPEAAAAGPGKKPYQPKQPVKGKPGRPKGSKNKPAQEPESLSYQTLKGLLTLLKSNLRALLPDIKCCHLVLDGFYGHSAYLKLALDNELKIISRFKSNACLYLAYRGGYSGKGRPKTKGLKVDVAALPKEYLAETTHDSQAKVHTGIYHFEAYTPSIKGVLLKVVVLVHTHQPTGRVSRTILFSNDLTLTATQLKEYYSLRFQLEFDFRDAKQYFGLSSFRNYKEKQVTNAVNIAFTLCLLSKILRQKMREKYNCPTMGIADMKVLFRIELLMEKTLKSIKSAPNQLLSPQNIANMAKFETIHL